LEKIAWSLSEVGRKIEEKIKKQERKSLDAHFYFIHTYISLSLEPDVFEA
jgi:hypothetical protein